MKSLFIPIFVVLTVAVYTGQVNADSYADPQPLDLLSPFHVGQDATHTTESQTKATIFIPPPPQRADVAETIRGQIRSFDELAAILDGPLPPARGPVEDGTFSPGLVISEPSGEELDDFLTKGIGTAGAVQNQPQRTSTMLRGSPTDPLGNGMLLFITATVTIGLVWMAFVAYDYRQRWMQSLTMQNDRYIVGGVLDMEWDNAYSGSTSLYEGYGLTSRSI